MADTILIDFCEHCGADIAAASLTRCVSCGMITCEECRSDDENEDLCWRCDGNGCGDGGYDYDGDGGYEQDIGWGNWRSQDWHPSRLKA